MSWFTTPYTIEIATCWVGARSFASRSELIKFKDKHIHDMTVKILLLVHD